MKLFTASLNDIHYYMVGNTPDDVRANIADVDQTFTYLPFTVEEVTVPGFDIVVTETVFDPPPKRGKGTTNI